MFSRFLVLVSHTSRSSSLLLYSGAALTFNHPPPNPILNTPPRIIKLTLRPQLTIQPILLLQLHAPDKRGVADVLEDGVHRTGRSFDGGRGCATFGEFYPTVGRLLAFGAFPAFGGGSRC